MKAPIKSNQLIKRSQYVEYFGWLEQSNQVKKLEKEILDATESMNDYQGEKLPELIELVKAIGKEIEKERSKINEPLKEIKSLNQGVFKPLSDSASRLLGALNSRYRDWYAAEQERKQKIQAELDKIAKEERERIEAENEKREANGERVLPPAQVVTLQVVETPIARSILRKAIEVELLDKLEFIKHVAESGDVELLDCIAITNTTGIRNKAKRNPGQINIPGVAIAYLPSQADWGIK